MKTFLWGLLAFFLIGDALFVLPVHVSSDKITSNYAVNFKKDSLLLRDIFLDSNIQLRLNMPPLYDAIYKSEDSIAKKPQRPYFILVNVEVFHDLSFAAVAFPFYKVTSFRGVIPFYSIIRASNAPDMDSTALVGNITINGKLSVAGISSPVYARSLVEKELVRIIQKEMGRIEIDINRRPAIDTSTILLEPEPPVRFGPKKRKK